LESNQQNGAAVRHTFANFAAHLRRHRALTRITLATLSLGVALAASMQGAAAGPEPSPLPNRSILPDVIGTGVLTDAPVVIRFSQPMDRQSVEAALSVRPETAWRPSWNSDGSELTLHPALRWRTDARYVVTLGDGARTAVGRPAAGSLSMSFTTETAPVITDFQLFHVEESPTERVRARAETDRLDATMAVVAEPSQDTTSDVSARTSVLITFSVPMDRASVARGFAISPRVKGDLTVDGSSLVFEPTRRLKPGARYAVSLIGARDERGNPLEGDLAFSFTTRAGAQVTKVAPPDGARNVRPDEVLLWFSQPMNGPATRAALRVKPAGGGAAVAGVASWNETRTQLRYTFRRDLSRGRAFRVTLAKGAHDLDGNPVTGTWRFRTKPPRPDPVLVARSAPTVTQSASPRPRAGNGPPAPASIQQYALWQINQSRADYGFAPLRLDAAISQVAADHAWDMIRHGYFSHTGRDGSLVAERLRRAGIGFGHSGENICYLSGSSVRGTLDWCHRTFMAEPYPGHYNHIANILSPRFTRVGIGIAQSGGQIKVVWDFAG
jgi:uncharacterized protein YkwD